MQVALVAAVVGIVAGYLTGGRLKHLGSRPVRLWPLLVIGAALQALAPNGVALVAGMTCLLVFCLANLQLTGMAIVAIGLALNVAVIAANGAMPVRAKALVRAGVVDDVEAARAEDLGGKRRLEEPGDLLTPLGDVLPARPLRQVLSFGDLIVAVGTADVVARLMGRRRARVSGNSRGDGERTGGRFSRLWIRKPKRSPLHRSGPVAVGGATPVSSVVSSGATSEPSRPAVPAGASGARSKVSAPGS